METLAKLDIFILHFFNIGLANPVLDAVMEVLSNRNVWLAVAATSIAFAALTKNRNALYACFAIAVSVTLSDWVCYEWLKPLFGRIRPCYDTSLALRAVVDGCGSQLGFPSNHAANGMSAALVGWVLLGRRWGLVMMAAVLFVGLSRIYLGLHFPSDVAGGFLFSLLFSVLGLVAARLIARFAAQVFRQWTYFRSEK